MAVGSNQSTGGSLRTLSGLALTLTVGGPWSYFPCLTVWEQQGTPLKLSYKVTECCPPWSLPGLLR